MDDDGKAGHGEEQDRVELIELSLPEIARVRPRRARFAAIAIGAFTGLTCLGLASSMVAPRILDRRFDPRADIAVASTRPTGGDGQAASALGSERPPVAATAVVERAAGGTSRVVHVSGAALATVGHVDVRVLVGGRTVGSATTVTDGHAIGLWSADVAIPTTFGAHVTDAIAVVEVRWAGLEASGGPTVLIVPLGDGRRRG